MIRLEFLLLSAFALALGACATAPTPPYKAPVQATPPSGRVAVSQAVNVFDASGSQETTFADGKAALESIVGVMPNGSYAAGNVHFGGMQREETGLASFDRARLAAAAKDAAFLQGSTPLYDVITDEVGAAIGDGSGRAAIVIVSDGLATDYAGRADDAGRTLAAARAVAESRSGETCFHTVQSGSDPAGADLLRQLAGATPCGSYRTAASLSSASALQAFSREVYLGGAAPAPAPRPAPAPEGDADADGVADSLDACPGTLRRARVDSRGCWTLSDLRFAVNGAAIEAGYAQTLDEDIEVLRANPDVRIRIDGHTDSDGSEAYNQGLSERRAASVRDYFVEEGGLDADRFEVKGFGESQPIAPNDTRDNKRRNRRVELTIID